MPNPDFNDPRNMKRDRKGHQRLSTHPDDLEDTAGHGAHDRHASFEQSPPDSLADDTLQAERNAGADASDHSPDMLEESRPGQPDEPGN